ncbi:CHAT domain-containing protein [Laspinema sp. A4]|uniref:CHAT domain-containing protein n=1 Tax=Laspinema sp. D2d TaxID=2953686 RepID=UPI0021BAE0E9|nr:CHAT domain-containing protein [Laspinema sp. D2d]MCT7982898.1 CHAT domain-containing protein [Laspinema sp. D2d]
MQRIRFIIVALLGFSLSLTVRVAWGLSPEGASSVSVNAQAVTELLTEGKSRYEAGQFSEAVQFWEQAAIAFSEEENLLGQAQALSFLSLAYQSLGDYPKATEAIASAQGTIAQVSQGDRGDRETVRAQILNAEGRLQFFRGNAAAALSTWQEATAAYRQAEDPTGEILSQINQARAMQALGLYRRATTLLEQVEQRLQNQPDRSIQAVGLLNLGEIRRASGAFQESERLLRQALSLQNNRASTEQTGGILLSLGNTLRALNNSEEAIQLYQTAAERATQFPQIKLQAQLNQLSLLIETGNWEKARQLSGEISEPLSLLSASRPGIYAQVNFAKNLICLEQKKANCLGQEEENPIPGEFQTRETIPLLQKAVMAAREIRDQRAESYALGNLGRIYEEMGEVNTARQYSETALNIAQTLQASDIAYQWQWQLGRLRIQSGDQPGAIAAYSEAVNSLQSLRSDLVAIDRQVQFSFRDRVEPLYRQLVSLLLDRAKQVEQKPAQEYLKEARATIESLQLAELDNYFKDACLDVQPEQIDEVDPKAAALYPMILSERLAVIVSISGQPLIQYETRQPAAEIEKTLEEFQQFLNPAFSNRQRLKLSQEIYDWLIRPAEPALAENGVETLVFVLDGFLRNLPMSALHDGDRYVIERYNVALTPGLQLLAPRPLTGEKIQVLSAGLTDARQGFSALPGVQLELKQIGDSVPNAKVLLDSEFTELNLTAAISAVDFPVIHLATHGQFSSDSEQTFILTWDDKIRVTEFEELLQTRELGLTNPIELLVLSACQTAAGDKQAGLGLAGVAVRSGARSTLATLWAVNDESTALLVTEFYRNLVGLATADEITQSGQLPMSKAQALRQSQLTLLQNPKYEHPFYWAPFVLVGNWL